jgi:hypothetical protein
MPVGGGQRRITWVPSPRANRYYRLVWAVRLLTVWSLTVPAALLSTTPLLHSIFWGENPREAVTRAHEAVRDRLLEIRRDRRKRSAACSVLETWGRRRPGLTGESMNPG